MKHIFKDRDIWYLIDMRTMKLFTIGKEEAKQLEEADEPTLRHIERSLQQPTDPITRVETDKEKCERLILNLADMCNLGCKYCYAGEGSYGQEETAQKRMSFDTVKSVFQRTVKLYPKGVGTVQFFGGEPLLNKEVLRQGVLYMNEYCENHGIKPPLYTCVTNGTLIDDADIDFFNTYFASVTISLDGEKEMNDLRRVFKGSDHSVYDRVVDTIHRMEARGRQFYLALEATISDGHIERFLQEKHSASFDALHNLPCDVIHISPEIYPESVHSPVETGFSACRKCRMRYGGADKCVLPMPYPKK